MAKAEEWYKRSAALGSDWGMMNLGLFYQHGLYGEPDLKRAKEWFEKAIAVHGVAAVLGGDVLQHLFPLGFGGDSPPEQVAERGGYLDGPVKAAEVSILI